MRRICYIGVLAVCLVTALIMLPRIVQAQQSDQTKDLEYTRDQIKDTPAEVFLDRLAKAEPGYDQWAAMHALGKKAKDSNADDRRTILTMVVKVMNDTKRSEYQRFQCCYVIGEAGDEKWVPELVDVLL